MFLYKYQETLSFFEQEVFPDTYIYKKYIWNSMRLSVSWWFYMNVKKTM